MVHGDDYMSSGRSVDLDWLEGELAKQYKIKTQRLRDVDGQREVKILNRIVRVTPGGYEVEADPLHAELIAEQIAIADGPEVLRTIATPGTDVDESKSVKESLEA